jgi:hypothetical protein
MERKFWYEAVTAMLALRRHDLSTVVQYGVRNIDTRQCLLCLDFWRITASQCSSRDTTCNKYSTHILNSCKVFVGAIHAVMSPFVGEEG